MKALYTLLGGCGWIFIYLFGMFVGTRIAYWQGISRVRGMLLELLKNGGLDQRYYVAYMSLVDVLLLPEFSNTPNLFKLLQGKIDNKEVRKLELAIKTNEMAFAYSLKHLQHDTIMTGSIIVGGIIDSRQVN